MAMIGTLPANPSPAATLCRECALPSDWCVCRKPLAVEGGIVRRAGVMVAEIAGAGGQWRATPVRANVSKRADAELRGKRFASPEAALDALRTVLAGGSL
jgi:hypothetical protein